MEILTTKVQLSKTIHTSHIFTRFKSIYWEIQGSTFTFKFMTKKSDFFQIKTKHSKAAIYCVLNINSSEK